MFFLEGGGEKEMGGGERRMRLATPPYGLPPWWKKSGESCPAGGSRTAV